MQSTEAHCSEDEATGNFSDKQCECENDNIDYDVNESEYQKDCKREVDPRTDNLIRLIAMAHGTPLQVDFLQVCKQDRDQ